MSEGCTPPAMRCSSSSTTVATLTSSMHPYWTRWPGCGRRRTAVNVSPSAALIANPEITGTWVEQGRPHRYATPTMLRPGAGV
jgi:hypothetical protein